MSDIRYTKRGEQTLAMARREALSMGMSSVDTPHIARALRRQIGSIDFEGVGLKVEAVLADALMTALADEDAE